MKTLLIEPDRILSEVYQQALKKAGIDSVHAHTAQEALARLEETSIDIIVIELQMASHNGVEFMYELRSYPEWQAIPIILHTFIPKDNLQVNDVLLAKLGIIGYFYKPTTSLERLVGACESVVPMFR